MREREGGEGCSGRREIFTPTGGCRIYYVKTKINVDDFLNFIPYRAVNTHCLGCKNSQLMPYSEIITLCSEIHTKHINTQCVGRT